LPRYATLRLFQAFVVLIGVSLILFLLLHVIIPGDPVRILLGGRSDAASRQALSQELGLDKPLYAQYFSYMGRLVKGDLGTSYRYKEPVGRLLLEALPYTFRLAALATLIEMFLGVFAVLISYLSKRSFIDVFLTVATTFLISVPVFWLAMLFQYWFGLKWRVLPVSGAEGLASYILPALTLALVSTALIIRILKASLKETAGSDYVLLARAKGLSPARVLLKHQLKNAFIPSLTFIGMDFGSLMTGAVATEIVFNFPGVGLLMYHAVLERDIPVILSGVLVLVAIYIVVNLAVDLLHGLLNPVVREQL